MQVISPDRRILLGIAAKDGTMAPGVWLVGWFQVVCDAVMWAPWSEMIAVAACG
jgi:hypothetical protein